MMFRSVLAGVWVFSTLAVAQPRSGIEDASPQTRAMQQDDTANPAFLWVQQGEMLWGMPNGVAGKSCASCHGAAEAGMRGVSARYPDFDVARGRAVSLSQRVNICRETHQAAAPLAVESEEMLALTASVGLQSRGMKMSVSIDGPMRPTYDVGEKLFTTRQGQLNLSCQQCHDQLAGQKLGGSVIPQGHSNAYPIYRLEWQGLGSVYRRFRNCMVGVRAEPYEAGGPEMVALETYLGVRAGGLVVETPGVRP
jgi:sulfur-oxidizing protein SoxA